MLYPNIAQHADVIGLSILTSPTSLALHAVNAEGIAQGNYPLPATQAALPVAVERGTMAELSIRLWQGESLHSM